MCKFNLTRQSLIYTPPSSLKTNLKLQKKVPGCFTKNSAETFGLPFCNYQFKTKTSLSFQKLLKAQLVNLLLIQAK